MKKDERTIQFFDLSLKGKTRCRDLPSSLASPKSLSELLHQFIEICNTQGARKTFTDYEFNLEDIKEHDDHWVLLLNVLDTSVADQVTNKQGGTKADRHVIELRDGRGIETSSHIIIYKAPDVINKHLMLYEKSSNIPFQKALSYLNHLARFIAKTDSDEYKKPHPSGEKNRFYNTYCEFSVFGHPSDEFINELNTGKISDIRITSDADIIKGYDSNKFPELISTEIKMSVSHVSVFKSGGNWKYLKKALEYADTLKAPFVRVQFSDKQGAGKSAILSTDTGNLTDTDKYIKKARIKYFSAIVRTSYEQINYDIVNRMLELI